MSSELRATDRKSMMFVAFDANTEGILLLM